MNTDHKDKVKRWKIAIQHFNFDVLHIDGKDNIEADALSRLVPFPSKDEPNTSLNSLELFNYLHGSYFKVVTINLLKN